MLLSPTQTLTVVLGGAVTANQCTGCVHYEDVPLSGNIQGITPNFGLPGNNAFITASAAAVTIAAAPSVGYFRRILALEFYNADTATITATFTITDTAGTNRVIFKGTRATLENLNYTLSGGWQGYSVAMAKQ